MNLGMSMQQLMRCSACEDYIVDPDTSVKVLSGSEPHALASLGLCPRCRCSRPNWVIEKALKVVLASLNEEKEKKMLNRAMQELLDKRECLDVCKIGNELSDGTFRLTDFVEDVDYCDAKTESWIWSIGKHVKTGEIYAALDGRYYQHPDYECLWLR